MQIENSKPAVKFNVISKPNYAVRQAVKQKQQAELSEVRKKQLKFWTDFQKRLLRTGKFLSLQSPKARTHFDIALGRKGIHLSNNFNTDKNILTVKVSIHKERADDWLPFFESKKMKLKKALAKD